MKTDVQELPIDAVLPQAIAVLRGGENLVVEAPPGAGKTTRLPPALLPLTAKEILVLEPRRLAARLAARRVAQELGEELGETVGYQVRFEDVGSPRTRLRFLTEGVLTRRLLRDPRLERVGIVVLDEFHERHLDCDLALALLRRLQQTDRPDLRLVVMSATLNAGPIAVYLGSCPVVRSEGRVFETRIRFSPTTSQKLDEQVAGAVQTLLREGSVGDFLVFLPGAAEIRQCQRTLEPVARRHGLLVLPLHGDLSPAEQDRAVLPAEKPKVVLSTNVAESSITIEGVRAVIDTGLARIAGDAPWSGIPQLRIARISQASAAQRAGRAGRTGPGEVIRLYPADEFHRRPAFDTPEIERRELSTVVLELKAMGLYVAELPWFEAPPPATVDAATQLLKLLGAIDDQQKLTRTGEAMSKLPLHPRLARLLVEAQHRGVPNGGCAVAALLSAGDRLPPETHRVDSSDLLALQDGDWSPGARKAMQQLRRLVSPKNSDRAGDAPLLESILAAYPDRVAKRRGQELLLAGGGSALLAAASVVRQAPFLVAVDVEERPDQTLPLVRLASAIEPEWLIDLFPDQIEERNLRDWNRRDERVEVVSGLRYQGLVLEESRSGAPPDEATADLLAEKAWEAGIGRFVNPEELSALQARVEFASRHSGVQPLADDHLRKALRQLCEGLRSFRELAAACADGGFIAAAQAQLTPAQWRIVEETAPARLRLPSGRQAPIRYSSGQSPWLASRLQDFFGMRESPRLANGKVPLLLHLLAPNQRPVQMTTDLAGFWDRLYPQVRRELSRRYPRHAWPENPHAQ